MAGLTAPNGNGEGDARVVGEAPAPVDPRAVRVRLAAASRTADELPMLVAPPARPLRMTNSAVGRGPLGGAAVPGVSGGAAQGAAGTTAEPSDAADTPGQPHVDGEPVEARIRGTGRGRYVLDEAAGRTRVVLEAPRSGEGGSIVREVLVDGFRFDVEVESERIAALRERAARGRGTNAGGGPLRVKAIIPGRVVSVSVAPGDAVTAGQQLLVVEAMKMQNELRSPRDGTIDRVGVAPGVSIEVGDLLVVIS